MNQEELIEKMTAEGYHDLKEILGRGLCGIKEFMFTMGLCYGIDEDGYKGRWCYPKEQAVEAHIAFTLWKGQGDPIGPWIKYKGEGGERSNKKPDNGYVKGDLVHYVRDGETDPSKFEKGVVKRVHPDGGKAWVVYNCAGEWSNYEDYAAALTDFNNLRDGWL